MSEGYRMHCADETWRLSNDELNALMAEVARRGKGSAQQLFLAITPLLIAFYGGQVQAGRMKMEDLEHLVQQTLLVVYQNRASHDPGQPFRAWLLDIARSKMGEYGRGHRDASSMTQVAGIHFIRKSGLGTPESEVERLLEALPREQDHVIREAQFAWLAHA